MKKDLTNINPAPWEKTTSLFQVDVIDMEDSSIIETQYVESETIEEAEEEVFNDIKSRLTYKVGNDPEVEGQYVVYIYLDDKLFKVINELDGYDEKESLDVVKELVDNKDLFWLRSDSMEADGPEYSNE